MAEQTNPDPHRGSYRDAETHMVMLRDVVRTAAYYQAIHSTVSAGSRVIDFGTGTGTLAIFATRCGAQQVDAIEREAIIGKAREIAKLNDCESIRFHHTEPLGFETDGPVDIIVSEWMGHCLFVESMLEPLLLLRDRWLKPEGVMLPRRVSVSAALVVDEQIHEDLTFLQNRPWGIYYDPIAELPLRQSQLVSLGEQQIMPDHVQLCSLDMKTITQTPERLHGTLKVQQATTTYGLAAWFDTDVDDDVQFGTGPHQPSTHWQQIFFPFPEPFDVCPSRPISISLQPPRSVENGDISWSWRISDGQTTVDIDEAETFAITAKP